MNFLVKLFNSTNLFILWITFTRLFILRISLFTLSLEYVALLLTHVSLFKIIYDLMIV